MTITTRRLIAGMAFLALPAALLAQRSPAPGMCASPKDTTLDHATMDHAMHADMLADCASLPTLPGQAAYGAIGEVVRLLKADPKTDWSRVNIEALRQHLIDMDDVIMRSRATQRSVAGGVDITVTSSGRTLAAIKRMVVSHAHALGETPDYTATAQALPDGARLTVTAKDPGNAHVVARIRALGFAGLMTEGDHHAIHHLSIARGEAAMHGK